MKKIFCFLACMLVLFVYSMPVYAENKTDVKILLDGEPVHFSDSPFIEHDTMMVPFRVILENLGLSISWNAESKTVTAKNATTEIKLVIGNLTATVNGTPAQIPAAPKVVDGTTYVPLRFIGETTGKEVKWYGDQRLIQIGKQIKVPVSQATTEGSEPQQIGKFQDVKGIPSTMDDITAMLPLPDNKLLILSENNLFTYDAGKQTWATEALKGINQPKTMAALPDGKVLLIGGLDEDGLSHTQTAVYDPAAHESTSAAPMPGTAAGWVVMNAAAIPEGQVIVMGYYNIYGTDESIFYLYDSYTNKWTEPAGLNYVADDLLVNKLGDALNYGGKTAEHFSTGQLYRSQTEQFFTTSIIPYPVNSSGKAALLDGNFILVGGSEGGGANIHPTDKTLLFNVNENQWKSLAPLLTERHSPAASTLPDGKVLVAGGLGPDLKDLSSTEIYDPSANKWSVGPTTTIKNPRAVTLSEGDVFLIGREYDEKWQAEFLDFKGKATGKTSTAQGSAVASLSGEQVVVKTLFEKNGWIYKDIYTLESSANFRFHEGDVEHTRKYMIREHSNGSNTEILHEGRYSFIKEKDDFIYYIESGYLKKMAIGQRYGEHVRFSKDIYRKLAGTSFSFMGNYAGQTVAFGMTDFDGEYVYAWYTEPAGFGNIGYPIRYKYDGSDLEMLSTIPGQNVNNRVGALQVAGDYVIYTSIPFDSNYSDAVEKRDVNIHAVKKDGSSEQDIAISSGFQIYHDKIYFGDMSQPAVNPQFGFGWKIYSINPDGSDKKLISDEGQSTDLFFIGSKIIFGTNSSGKIVMMNVDGTEQEVLITNEGEVTYELVSANADYIVYNKSEGYDWKGTYQLDLRTRAQTLKNAPHQ